MFKTRHELYARWKKMHQRCQNLNDSNYPRYGARGITICPEWYDFWTYVSDVGQCPGPEYSVDRIDNDGNYEPSNIRWATPKQQANNRCDNINMTLDGTTHTKSQWSRITGIGMSTICSRLRRGWSVKKTLTARVIRHHLTLNGVTHCQAEWSRLLGIDQGVISIRHKNGWSDERILTTPVDMRFSHRSAK